VQNLQVAAKFAVSGMRIASGCHWENFDVRIVPPFLESSGRQSRFPPVFILAVIVVATWGLSGPFFHYSDSWQLIINTGTTIITFLMVFLIQNTQNRDAKAMHLKLDELIRSIEGARNQLIDLQNSPEENIELFGKESAQTREEHQSVEVESKMCNGV
jgi:low affinity Fe/Cu permease